MARAVELSTRPTLDGEVLEDSAWAGLVPIRGFWQTRPFEGQPASQKTEVYFGYTAITPMYKVSAV